MRNLEEAKELQALMKKDYEDRNITNRHLILDYDLTDTVSELNKKYELQNMLEIRFNLWLHLSLGLSLQYDIFNIISMILYITV